MTQIKKEEKQQKPTRKRYTWDQKKAIDRETVSLEKEHAGRFEDIGISRRTSH